MKDLNDVSLDMFVLRDDDQLVHRGFNQDFPAQDPLFINESFLVVKQCFHRGGVRILVFF